MTIFISGKVAWITILNNRIKIYNFIVPYLTTT